MDDSGDLRDVQRIHWELRGDLDLISRYGEGHPESWAGVWFDNEPAVRLVTAFSRDVAGHDAALRPLLAHPELVVVAERPHSLAELGRIRQEIECDLRRRSTETGLPILSSIGLGSAVIIVDLQSDQEDVAGELAARYGRAVELRVGAFSFPDGGPGHGRERSRSGQRAIPRETPAQPETPVPPGWPAPLERTFAGLELSVEVDKRVIEVGDDGYAMLILRNVGQQRIGPLDSGEPLVGSLLNAAREPVGSYTGWIAGVGRTIDLAPGQSASLRVIYGTASSRRELGYTLPPGEYWLEVQLRLLDGPGQPDQVVPAPLTQVTIASRAQRRDDDGR